MAAESTSSSTVTIRVGTIPVLPRPESGTALAWMVAGAR